MYIIAQVLGIVGVISLFLSILYNNKKQIVILQIISSLFYGLEYLFLNAIPAMIMSFISLLRCIIFYLFERKNKKVPVIVLIIIILAIILIAKFLNYGVMGYFPIICTLLYTIGIWQKNLNLFRIITLIVSCIWIGYNIYVGAYPSLIENIVEIITSLTAIYKFNLDDKKKKRGKR